MTDRAKIAARIRALREKTVEAVALNKGLRGGSSAVARLGYR